jgi:3-deoxy-D-manno-octulosonic-acid transferase
MIFFFLLVYNFLFILWLPFVVVILLISNKYRKDVFYRLFERFAIRNHLSKNAKKTLWIHCASLGEMRIVETILENLEENHYFVALTSITRSGREYAQKLKKANLVALLPLDIYPIMRKAFATIKPDVLVLIETELWVSMLYVAFRNDVKVILVNARISDASFKVYKQLKFFWSKFVGLIDVIVARNKDDAEKFKLLTAGKTKIVVSGNIKYDSNFTSNLTRKNFFLKNKDFVFTAGSTRSREEEFIANAYDKISTVYSKIKFFVAPRHLSRIGNIMELLEAKGVKYSLFSKGNFKNNFILVDVFGELQNIYSVSDICFLGGSIVRKGGQNPIEPAAYGKPVLFGKNMNNFKIEAEILIKFGGALIVKDVDDLVEKIWRFMSNKNFIKEMGQNALRAVASQKGALAFTLKKIKEILDG